MTVSFLEPLLRSFDPFTRAVSFELPERLVAGPFNATPIGPRETRVAAYNGYDPLALPKSLRDLSPYFDGRPTREALGNVRRRTGIGLGEGLVRKLADFEVLVQPPGSGTA